MCPHVQAKGFEMTYLEKVPEVKDTVHKQSLLHHACSVVVENFPQSTDLYSEIGAITRSAKVRSLLAYRKLTPSLCRTFYEDTKKKLSVPTSLLSGGF